MKEIPKSMEIYAWSVSCFVPTGRPASDNLELMQLYRVRRFIVHVNYYPYGVIVEDNQGNIFSSIYFMREFIFFEICLN